MIRRFILAMAAGAAVLAAFLVLFFLLARS